MKWGCKWEGNVITISTFPFRSDYQSFSMIYQNSEVLVRVALASLEIAEAP